MPKSAGIRITIWIEVEPRSGDLPRRWWGGRLKPAREVMPTMPAFADPFRRSSDHWSFARAGLPGARLGSTPYAAYHSPADLPAVVDPAQLARTGRLLLAWLAP